MIAAEVIELLIKFDGDPDKLAREILRLRAEIEEAHRQRQAAAEYQRYHQQATWLDR
jgi:hypothetical protein